MYHLKNTYSSTLPDHNLAFTQPKHATFGKRVHYRRENKSKHCTKAQSEKAKEKRTERKWCAQKMLKDSMICRREGKRARFASGLARTPLPSRHIVLHFAPPRSGAFLLFRLAFGRVLVGALSASASAARKSATCSNKHTSNCKFG